MKILVASDIAPDAITLLQEHFDVDVRTDLSEEELVAAIPGYDALVVRSKPRVPRSVIEASSLSIIARAGVGLDNIDLAACKERGIEVVNSPAALSESVAELVFAMLLSFERKIVRADNAMKEGLWLKKELKGTEICNKTLGIIGFGRIGSHMAKIAAGFGMRVIAYDVHWNEDLAKGYDVEFWDLDLLYREADYLSLHVPLLPSTKGMISKRELGMMKKDAVLINTSRGGIVDEEALYNALSAGTIRGACLDVFEHEPPEDSPLLHLDNIIATPHIGASTREAQDKAGVIIAEQLIAWAQKNRPV
ncbi:MAG: hydroxyacid dehydrogenase [Candidatus Methanofastidiosa archaeon]|nr:hydroxyacid dehydrogenase [Candidatus Methanofastidiosa archaeon]